MHGESQFQFGGWYWSGKHSSVCRLVDLQQLWGQQWCQVWLPDSNIVERLPLDDLRSLDEYRADERLISYVAAAARVADALTQDVLLAPIEASVIPLPHQIRALSRAISDQRIRYLLADEVGLGKTIEAGLIMRELKLRGLVRRTLVVTPKGLATQWVAELKTHFDEDFQLLVPSEFGVYRRMSREENVWRQFDQVVCPMDSVKPLDGRRGWSRDQVAQYNRERFEDLVGAAWDLVIVDEAHRLGGSNEQVARYRLGQGLSEAAPYLLLLSATPHQGKTDAFHRLLSLLESDAFPDVDSVNTERVEPYVIRTEKRRAIDAEGKPLFKPRRTQLVAIPWDERHKEQRAVYEAVTDYVRQGYNQAMREKRSYIGFLMILMQRLVASSMRAIRVTLERRLDALEVPEEQLTLFPIHNEDEWSDLDGQEQLEVVLKSRLTALKDERSEVKLLLEAARRCDHAGPDVKAEALLDWIYRLQQEEGEPDLKVLIFTEFVPTQEMLAEFLRDRGFSVVCLNGSMNMDERNRVQQEFSRKVRVLISTDAGGEGLNLQFCHVVVNFDIPWNPMRLEQRIGRVDRIGQTRVVRAINLVLEDSVEYRVREVLEEKLAVILDEFGIDKTGDVLDSAEAGQIFDELYVDAIMSPEGVEASVENVVSRIRSLAEETRENAAVFGGAAELDPGEAQRLMLHPLWFWVERMTVNYLLSHGGQAERCTGGWSLKWSDGFEVPLAVFTAKDAAEHPAAQHLTLEEDRIRVLATRLPMYVPGQTLPVLDVSDIPADVCGVWSLWQISLIGPQPRQSRMMPLFLHDDGRSLGPTARRIWDNLLAGSFRVKAYLNGEGARLAVARAKDAAETHGEAVYNELLRIEDNRRNRERQKDEYAFAARRRSIDRIGLPAVRSHRLTQLECEQESWRKSFDSQAAPSPDMTLSAVIRLEGGDR